MIDGAFCVCALPLPVLRDMNVDVAPEMKAAIGAINYAKTGKIGIQFKRRFWEEDDGIYGGITKTDQPITQILYPSYGFQSRKGVLVGYYHNGDLAGTMGDLTPEARLARAMEQGAKIHPQYPGANSRTPSRSPGTACPTTAEAGRNTRRRRGATSINVCSNRTAASISRAIT